MLLCDSTRMDTRSGCCADAPPAQARATMPNAATVLFMGSLRYGPLPLCDEVLHVAADTVRRPHLFAHTVCTERARTGVPLDRAQLIRERGRAIGAEHFRSRCRRASR